MTLDVTGALIAHLPSTITIASGYDVPIKWLDETDDVGDREPPVYGTVFRVSSPSEFTDGRDSQELVAEVGQVDVIAYSDGTDEYFVEERDIKEVTDLSGFVAASPYTFIEDTDFEVVEGPEYTTYSSIRWLDGGTKPDDASNFTVTYDHYKLKDQSRSRFHPTYRLAIHVIANTDGGFVDVGDGGNLYLKGRLGEQLYEGLLAYLGHTRGKYIGTGLKTRGFIPLGQSKTLVVSDGENAFTYHVDLRLTRNVIYSEDVERVGKVVSTTSTNLE